MNINPFHAAKNLQPARSLRGSHVTASHSALSDLGFPPHLVELRGGGNAPAPANRNGTRPTVHQHQPRSSSQSRKHDVLRAPSVTHGRSSTPTSRLTFNANILPVGMTQYVTVSHVQNGPKHFMVHLSPQVPILREMTAALARVPLRPVNRRLQLGMACLACHPQHRAISRVLITALRPDGTCTVSYVDYGHSETLHPGSLYEIPPEFLQHEILAPRCALSNVRRLDDVNADVAGIFARLVADKDLTLKVVPPEGPPFVSYCVLNAGGIDILDRLVALCQAQLYRYPSTGTLHRGGSYAVVIRYIESCAQFFVHTIDNVATFDQMMDDLSAHCRGAGVPVLPSVGDAYAVSLGSDDFYRAEVLEVGNQKVTVRLVDYGNSISVDKGQLRRLSPAFVHQRPEAYECCLEGFEESTSDELSTPQLEMLSEGVTGERKTFKLIVYDIRDGKTIVNLLDESETPVLNVSKKLLKLKNPIKFTPKDQQDKQKAQQGKPAPGAKLPDAVPQQQQQQQLVAQSTNKHSGGQQKQLLGSSGDSAKILLSSSGVSSSGHTDYIDLTNEEWSGGPPLPGHQSSGYEQHQPQQSSPAQRNNRTSGSGYGRDSSNNSSRDSSSSNSKSDNNSSKRNSFGSPANAAGNAGARNDIPRLNKERNQTPYYYEHDDRCADAIGSSITTTERSNQRSEMRNAGNAPDQSTLQQHHAPVPTTTEPPKSVTSPSTAPGAQAVADDYVPYRSSFPERSIPMNRKVEVTLSWWFSPEQFCVRLRGEDEKYHEMMKQLQKFYRNKANQQQPSSSKPSAGSIVIARHPKHNAFYRARVLKDRTADSVQKFKVELVDAGNKLILPATDLWLVERRFTRLAPLSIPCALPDIRLLCDVKELQGRIDRYLIGSGEKRLPLEATFLERVEGGRYYCTLESGGHDLKAQLIGDGSIAQLLVDVDLARLKGQTLKVRLVELNDLSSFRVQLLGHGAIFTCRLDGCEGLVDEAELLAELRSAWLDRYCLAQIVNVSTADERLIVSLLVPPLVNRAASTGGRQSVPTIAEMPVLVDRFDVYVTHVESPNCVYVQNVRWSSEIEQLIERLDEFYGQRQQGAPLADLTMHEMCVAQSPSDGRWYRAKIVSLQELDRIEVLLVDYGLREHVKHNELKVLDRQFLELSSAFAHRVHLPMGVIVGVPEERIVSEIIELTEGHELTLRVIDFRNSIWLVDITSNDYSIVSVLKDRQLVADVEHEMIFNQRQASTTPTPPGGDGGLSAGTSPATTVRPTLEALEATHQKIRAKICHVDNPSQLFIQLESDLKDLHQLQENLQIIASSLPPLRDFSADRHCIAQYSADDLWYRALIIDSHDDLIIQFVDFGHTDIVTSNKKGTLKDINDDLMRWKIYAKQCAMLVQPASPDASANGVAGAGGGEGRRKKPAAWKEVATTILRALDDVEVQFLAEAQGVHYIGLRSGEKDIAEMLVEKKLAVRLLYVPSDQICFTSHVESLGEFYLQLERDIYPLDTMGNYLSEVTQFADVPADPPPPVGLVCLAQYPDDELWYRAKVLSVSESTADGGEYEVFFLDYGNRSVVRALKQLDASIAELPRLCVKCALRLPEHVRGWSPAAEEKFLELAAMGKTVFTVQLHSPGAACATVELFRDGRNIVEQLVSLCEKGPNVAGGVGGGAVRGGASALAGLGDDDDLSSSFYLGDDERHRLDDSFYQLEDDKVFVSHVNSPVEFFIQFKNSFDALRNMEELLAAKADRCPAIPDSEIRNGLLCLAHVASSGKFCRALVLSEVHGRGQAQTYHTVLLVDYGNRAVATELRRMPAAIEEMARLAKKCCLEHYLPSDEHTLDPKRWGDIRGRFMRLTDTGREVFSVEIVRNDCDPMIIRLFTTPAGENVEDLIRDDPTKEMDPSPGAAQSGEAHSLLRAKPKQAFFRANSDLDFVED